MSAECWVGRRVACWAVWTAGEWERHWAAWLVDYWVAQTDWTMAALKEARMAESLGGRLAVKTVGQMVDQRAECLECSMADWWVAN